MGILYKGKIVFYSKDDKLLDKFLRELKYISKSTGSKTIDINYIYSKYFKDSGDNYTGALGAPTTILKYNDENSEYYFYCDLFTEGITSIKLLNKVIRKYYNCNIFYDFSLEEGNCTIINTDIENKYLETKYRNINKNINIIDRNISFI